MATFNGHCTGFSYLFFLFLFQNGLTYRIVFTLEVLWEGNIFYHPNMHALTKGLCHAKQVIIKAKFMVAVPVSCCIFLLFYFVRYK